jgi:hypothetical protein
VQGPVFIYFKDSKVSLISVKEGTFH